MEVHGYEPRNTTRCIEYHKLHTEMIRIGKGSEINIYDTHIHESCLH